MSNISGKINLAALKHARIKTKKGADAIVIPIAENHLFASEKGNVYLDLQAWELKEKKSDSKDTHLVKQSLPKDIFDKMSEEQKKGMPIIGNLIDWGAGGHGEPEPQNMADGVVDEDDLPF